MPLSDDERPFTGMPGTSKPWLGTPVSYGQDLLERSLDTWLRTSWFWYLHAALTTVTTLLMDDLAPALVCAACVAVSLLIARHGGAVADKLRRP